VGFPSGYSPKASYVVWNDGDVEFKKVDYDIEETIKALKQTTLRYEHIETISNKLKDGRF
jgi:hypothetical protein